MNRDVDDSGREPGLSRRLEIEARRISAQHDKLGELWSHFVSGVGESLAGGELVERLGLFASALRSHFALEERIHFPALHGSDAHIEPVLARLLEEHRQFDQDLERMERDLAARGTQDGLDLEAFTRRLAEHERVEEGLYPDRARDD